MDGGSTRKTKFIQGRKADEEGGSDKGSKLEFQRLFSSMSHHEVADTLKEVWIFTSGHSSHNRSGCPAPGIDLRGIE